MYTEKLFEKETMIKISIVKIDNKKLTKGIFNQINRKSPFDELYNLEQNVKFLGYVNDKSKCLIWIDGELLYKYEIKNLYPFLRIDLNKSTITDLLEVFPSEKVESIHSFKNDIGIHEYQDIEISCVLDKKEQYNIIEKKENIKEIVEELLKRQIFL